MRLDLETVRSCANTDDAERLTALLAEGADPLSTTDPFVTPLSLCAAAGASRCVEVLIAAGAALDAGDPPPVLAAALGGHQSVLERLVEASAQLEAIPYSEDEPGPLSAAAAAGNALAVRLLVQAGAIAPGAEQTLEDAFEFAMQQPAAKRVAVVKELFEGLFASGEVTVAGSGAQRALRLLVNQGKKGDEQLAALAARAKQRLDTEKAELREAEDAVRDARVGDLFELVSTAQPSSRRPRLLGVAAAVAALGVAALTRTLLRCRPLLDLRDSRGRTALLHAAAAGADVVVQELRLAGASLAIVDAEGRTARDLAEELAKIDYPLIDSMRRELRAVPPPSERGRAEGLPLAEAPVVAREAYELVMQRRLPELFPLLASLRGEEKRMAAGAAILADCANGCFTLVECLLDLGADVRARNESGEDVLMATLWNHMTPLSLVQRIVGLGPDLTKADCDGRTVLSLLRQPATHPNHAYVLSVLHERGLVPAEGTQ